ncbi:OLC1v1021190C1 [Oldenlandia corymbosa var. corymbosa]|uniref:OLC1v1021190C1 n=1 Tax=Oldenlandia corymbosa var. corymbosa TaxID=529605 RepID=A0AAV1BWB0_OLDCO|nr:OLC1v1021190C1 [Oldenlandia corymbosa var. corymbosa]
MPSHEVRDCDEQSTSPDNVAVEKSSEHSLEQGAVPEDGVSVPGGNSEPMENEDEEEDEEEDVDFNPFLKETPSREASSSLSSEIDGLDGDVADSASVALATESVAKAPNPIQDYPVGDTDHDEEVVTQTETSVEECNKLSEKQDGSGKKINAVSDLVVAGEISTPSHTKKPVLSTDEEDAICMRTRARYSLASFTLDELETFLQETDDEDDFQNVDDEAEYRKFLAAVLQGGDGDTQGSYENENANDEDEDEENDADFELELEEALESENDEDAKYEILEDTFKAAGRRPKTRQNRHQKGSLGSDQTHMGHRPLRPLLPCVPIVQRPGFPSLDATNFMRNPSTDFHPFVSNGFINGFTPHQIGQLHCLIHEHVQLLIQVFSVCVLDPGKRHIAMKVQELISEMLHVRENVLAWRRLPYPSFCFFPPCIHPSVPYEFPESFPEPSVNEASLVIDVWRNCTPRNNREATDTISAGRGRVVPQRNSQALERSFWVPFINGPICSVMDVAPLKLVANFFNDVSSVVQEYHRRQLGLIRDALPEKEPLFPLNTEPCDQVSRDNGCPTSTTANSSSHNDQTPKRTMASTLVEKARKQCVALVPKEIAHLACRFYPLFNPALYPHKPPPSSVANRVLFTDAEDELLAMGLMEYNSDWKAIQQRFLPCKSKHQIFVRQKNRSSSKAPENPIKAVRRMKNSPLTTEEIKRIEEGLKTYKLDWMSIWKLIVPHRDPSLLPRQWRIAIGTQKSYKLDANKKAKRQLYDLRRRNRNSAASASWNSSPEKMDNKDDKAGQQNGSRDNEMEREDEAYVHEAFLADWRPDNSKTSPSFPGLGLAKSPSVQTPSREGSQVREELNGSESGDTRPPISNKLPAAARSLDTQTHWRPYRARRGNSARVVKLAPDLPPVNLPPSVRVMSQSAFKSYQTTLGASSTNSSVVSSKAGNGVLSTAKGAANSKTDCPVATQVTRTQGNTSSSYHQPQESATTRKTLVAERRDDSDLQMHPLLFQTPEDGRFPYYPLHSNASTSINYVTRSPPQLNLSLFHNPLHARSAVNFLTKPSTSKEPASYQTGFHPLLQRSEDTDSGLVTPQSNIQLSRNMKSSNGRSDQVHNPLCTSNVSPGEKSSDLDLDIHLSFSRQPGRTDVGNRASEETGGAISVARAVKPSIFKSHKATNSPMQSSLYVTVLPNRNGSKFDSGSPVATTAMDEGVRNSAEDQSLPEIVMEQEELSDSEDDEIGENVEFECEEMADSEAEVESESEQMGDAQNEEVEEAGMDTDSVDQLQLPAKDDLLERDAVIRKVDNSSRLNLNSRPPGSPLMEAVDERAKSTKTCQITKPPCSSEKTSGDNGYDIDDHSKARKQATNLAQQTNSKRCGDARGSRKSRKRASGTQPSSSRGTSKKRNKSTDEKQAI